MLEMVISGGLCSVVSQGLMGPGNLCRSLVRINGS
jgi:hypothetical protein